MSDRGEETAITLASMEFNTLALDMKTRKEEGIKAWMEDNLKQGVDKDWEYSHIIWRRTPPADKRDWSAQLLDPGTAKIMGYMGVRPDHVDIKVEFNEETGQGRAQMKSQLVTILPILYLNIKTGEPVPYHPVIAEGVGSCTNKEKRFRVKWENYTGRALIADGGYTVKNLEDLKKMNPDRLIKDNPDIKKCLFFMPDPAAAGADNSLLKMSAKRSESDAVFQIPGVAQRFSQELDIMDTELNEVGNRVVKQPAPRPAEAPEEDADTLEALIMDIRMEYPDLEEGWLRAQAAEIMEKSDGLIVSMDSALKVLRKRLKREELVDKATPKPAEPSVSTPKPKEKPKAKPKVEPVKEAVGETITSKDGTVLGKLTVEGRDAKFTPSMRFTVDTPPFRSFLLDRVFSGMADADVVRLKDGELAEEEAFEFDVTEDNYKIVCIDMYNYGGERRLREIASSTRWTFEKMLDRARESDATPASQPEPSFNRASGEVVMCAAEVKARAAVQGLTGGDQLEYTPKGGTLWVSPTKFLGDTWNPINDALKGIGAMWIGVKPSHWELTLKKTQKPLEPKTATGLSIESVEKQLTDIHGESAVERLAVTENASFITVEPYQSLTSEEQTGFGETLRGMGATLNDTGRTLVWYFKKPKGGK